MTKNNKGRSGGDRLTPKTSNSPNPTRIHSSIKVTIVRLAVWGLIPASFATWLIQRGGLEDA